VLIAAALALGLIALGLLAGSAGGLGGKSKRSAAIVAGSDGGARAKCGGGKPHMVSGGFISDSPYSGDRQSTIAFFDSHPSGSGAWRVRAANFDGAGERVRAKVLCSRQDPKARTRTKKVRIAPAGDKRFRLGCRRGEEAIAGGFRAGGFAQDAGPELIATESRRKSRRKWRLAAYNNSGTVGGAIEGFVRCAKRRPRLVSYRVNGDAFDRAPVELKPSCEPGEELWSGGFKADFQSFDPFAAIIADRSYPRRKSWVSRFVGYQATGKVSAFAYCRPG
jgi:hypothetical protein